MCPRTEWQPRTRQERWGQRQEWKAGSVRTGPLKASPSKPISGRLRAEAEKREGKGKAISGYSTAVG